MIIVLMLLKHLAHTRFVCAHYNHLIETILMSTQTIHSLFPETCGNDPRELLSQKLFVYIPIVNKLVYIPPSKHSLEGLRGHAELGTSYSRKPGSSC